MKDNSIWTSLTSLRTSILVDRLRTRAAALVVLFLGAIMGLPGTAAAAPADMAGCIASAQNRSAPLDARGEYIVNNLPGLGFIANGAGSPQPFRIRITCNDGNVGETSLLFPEFEQTTISVGPVTWGQKTPVPTSVKLELPKDWIGFDNLSMNGKVTARYLDGSEKNVTKATSGTGYRTSAPGFVVVGYDGTVYLTDKETLELVSTRLTPPAFLTISAENDGVVSTRLLRLGASATNTGMVVQEDGLSAAGLEVRIGIAGYDDFVVPTDAAGAYSFSNAPLGRRAAQVKVIDRLNRRIGTGSFMIDDMGYASLPEITLKRPGTVQVTVLDESGKREPNVLVAVSDAFSREIGAMPTMQRTDANGQLIASGLPPGVVAALSSMPGYVSNPGSAVLNSGGIVQIELRKVASQASPSSIGGTVVLLPNRVAAAGAQIELTDASGILLDRQLIDGVGRFRFSNVPPQTWFKYQVKVGAELLLAGYVQSGAAGRQTELNLELPAQRGLSGQVVATDGQSPAGGVLVQLSKYTESLGWVVAATTRTRLDGSFAWRYLEAARYRLAAQGDDGASATLDADLSNAVPGSMLQGLRLQLASKVIETRLGLRATVLGALNFGALDAELFVKNSVCPAGCGAGRLASTSDRLVTDLLPPGRSDFSLRWAGRTQSFSVDVGTSTDGQTIERTVDFGAEASGVIQIPRQRSLYSFNVATGDPISVIAMGMGAAGVPPAAAVKLQLFDPSGQLLAEGAGFDPVRNSQPANLRLTYAAAQVPGRYTVVVSPLTADLANLGGYGLLGTVAAVPTALQPWAAAGPARFGGQATGRVFKRNGDLAPGTPVLVSAGPSGKLQLVEQVMTAPDGVYLHSNLPVGPLELMATDDTGTVFAKEQEIQAEGSRVVRDLHMSAKTQVKLTIRLSDSLLADGAIGDASLLVTDQFNLREIRVAFAPGLASASTEFSIAGDQATVKLTHPRNALLWVERALAGQDGSTITTDLALPTGKVAGRVVSGTLDPVDAQVLARSGGVVVGQAQAGADGRFALAALPANASMDLQASDAVTGLSVSGSAIPLESGEVSAGDLKLPTASVGGKVRFSDGAPLVGAKVQAQISASLALAATTDSSGGYTFARVPAGISIPVTATDAASGKSETISFQAAVGDRLTAADIVFGTGAIVQGRVRNAGGGPLPNVWVYLQTRGTLSPCYLESTNVVDKVLTDANGNYRFNGAAAVSTFVVANIPYKLGCDQKFSIISVGGPGTTNNVPDLVFSEPGSLLLRLRDPAGNAVPAISGWAGSLSLRGPQLSLIGEIAVPRPGAAGVLFETANVAAYTAVWITDRESQSTTPIVSASATVNPGRASTLDLVVPMLRGRVVYGDGTPANSTTVWMSQSDGWRYQQNIMAAMGGPEAVGGANVSNSFLLAGFHLGNYDIVVHDNATGLERHWRGYFTSLPADPMTLVMPGMARVDGCITAADGSPHRPGEVRLLVPGDAVSVSWVNQLFATPNAAGCFSFPKVRTGDVILQVFSAGATNSLLAWRTLTIPPSANNGTFQADIRYVAAAKAKCLTAAPETLGSNERASNVLVPLSIEQAMNGGYFNYPSLDPPAGNCLQQNAVVPGKYRAEQSIGDSGLGKMLRGHVLDLQFDPGQEVTAQMPAATTPAIPSWSEPPPVPVGASTYYLLSDPSGTNGQIYAFENTGAGYEWLPVFVDINAPGLLLNGLPLPPRRLMLQNPEPGSREFAIGPYEQGNGIQLKRRLYVPDTGGYVRLVETVTNNSNVTQTVTLTAPTPGNDYCEITRTVGLNDSVAASQAGYVGFENCEGAMLHVHAGAGTAANQAAVVALDPSEQWGGVTTKWSITLSPGQSGSVMHFILAAPLSDGRVDAITPLAEGLAGLTDPKMLQGLSLADRALIKNFTVGQ